MSKAARNPAGAAEQLPFEEALKQLEAIVEAMEAGDLPLETMLARFEEGVKLARQCQARLCIEVCSGQAITPGTAGVPAFDREKCVHCGACYWNCAQPSPDNPERMNIAFNAGTGGLHSAEN